jgi:hypothetical protein
VEEHRKWKEMTVSKSRSPQRKAANRKLSGYCALCRAYEVEHYGTLLNNAGRRHVEACKAAGCKHPPYYVFLPESQGPE